MHTSVSYVTLPTAFSNGRFQMMKIRYEVLSGKNVLSHFSVNIGTSLKISGHQREACASSITPYSQCDITTHKMGYPPLINDIDGVIKLFPGSHISTPKALSIKTFRRATSFYPPNWMSRSATLVLLPWLERGLMGLQSFDTVEDDHGRKIRRPSNTICSAWVLCFM